MFYSHILKLNIGKAAKYLLLFIDSLVSTFLILYAAHLVITLFYKIPPVEPISFATRSIVFALIHTTRFAKEPPAQAEKPKFSRVLLGSLIAGFIVGCAINLGSRSVALFAGYISMIGLSLTSALLMICIYYAHLLSDLIIVQKRCFIDVLASAYFCSTF